MDEPSLLTTADLAKRLGISERTLRDWSADDATLAGCILRQTRRSTWWSVQRLRERGYLTEAAATVAPRASQAVAS